ncbi:hypothetical protein [Halovenus rubra]|uniref:hypothetical protein n=1 Tax=Halovenus rubra TaxID=869890 RepID=UPI0036D2AFA8
MDNGVSHRDNSSVSKQTRFRQPFSQQIAHHYDKQIRENGLEALAKNQETKAKEPGQFNNPILEQINSCTSLDSLSR